MQQLKVFMSYMGRNFTGTSVGGSVRTESITWCSGFKTEPYEFDYGYHTYLAFKGTDIRALHKVQNNSPQKHVSQSQE